MGNVIGCASSLYISAGPLIVHGPFSVSVACRHTYVSLVVGILLISLGEDLSYLLRGRSLAVNLHHYVLP